MWVESWSIIDKVLIITLRAMLFQIFGWNATGINLGLEVSEWISKFLLDREDGGLK